MGQMKVSLHSFTGDKMAEAADVQANAFVSDELFLAMRPHLIDSPNYIPNMRIFELQAIRQRFNNPSRSYLQMAVCEEDIELPVAGDVFGIDNKRVKDGKVKFSKGQMVGLSGWKWVPPRIGRKTARENGWTEKQRKKEEGKKEEAMLLDFEKRGLWRRATWSNWFEAKAAEWEKWWWEDFCHGDPAYDWVFLKELFESWSNKEEPIRQTLFGKAAAEGADVDSDALEEDDGGYIWLYTISVDPACQRQGVGGMLVRWGTKLAGELGVPAGLSASPAGLGCYEKEGFKKSSLTIDVGKFNDPIMYWRPWEQNTE